MLKHIKFSLIFLICVSALMVGRPVFAQVRYPEVTLRDSLIQMLFQYGREVYHRGIDPQEAAFVFQRILVLDCRHNAAQEFLKKIRDKYPNISIKILGCSKEEQTAEIAESAEFEVPENVQPSSLRQERRLASVTAVTPASVDMIADASIPSNQIIIRATPLNAFSKPLEVEALTQQEKLESTGSIDNFPIIEPSLSVDPLGGSGDDMAVITEDCDHLRKTKTQLVNEITQFKDQIQAKDDAIIRYQKEITSIHGESTDASYALISQDQRDLIRLQQENIDYLEKELAEARAQLTANSSEEAPKNKQMRHEIAKAYLTAKENEMNLESRNREAQLLQRQLSELQEQLRLVKQILSEKNAIIESLQDDLEALRIESD